MGMKVAAVSLMCQDERVFAAMEMAGTPCPYMGAIGQEAADAWAVNPQERPDYDLYIARVEGQEDRARQVRKDEEKAAEQIKSDFVRACKRTKHTEGEHKGVNKSGKTCRAEWKEQQASEG